MSGKSVRVFEYQKGSYQETIILPIENSLQGLRLEVDRRLKLPNPQTLEHIFTDELVQYVLEDIYRRTEGNPDFREQECTSFYYLLREVGAYGQSKLVSAKSKLDPLLTKAFEIVANPKSRLEEVWDLLDSLRLGFVLNSRIGCSPEQPPNRIAINQSGSGSSTLLVAQRKDGTMAYIFNLTVGRSMVAIVASTQEQLKDRVGNIVFPNINESDVLDSLLAKINFE